MEKPRVAVLWPKSDENHIGLGQFFYKALRRLEFDAIGDPVWPDDAWSLRGRVKHSRFARGNTTDQRVEELRAKFAKHDASVVVMVKPPDLAGDHVDRLRHKRDCIVAMYFPDNPNWGKQVHDPTFLSMVRQVDLVLTHARYMIPIFYQMGAKRVERLAFAHDPEVHYPMTLSEADRPVFETEVSYAGTHGLLPGYWMGKLSGRKTRCFGPGWEGGSRVQDVVNKITGHEKYMTSVRGHGRELSKVCAGAKVVMNLIRAGAGCTHSMKSFELTASGGVVVCNRTDEQLELLPEGTLYFENEDEFLGIIDRLLNAPEERKSMREKAIAEAKPHTYERRMNELMALLDA